MTRIMNHAVIASLLCFLLVTGCWPSGETEGPGTVPGDPALEPTLEPDTDPTPPTMGGLTMKVKQGTADDDVAGFLVTVYSEDGETEIASMYVPVESETLPDGTIENAGDDHIFGDAYFFLPVGVYDVTVQPMKSETEPSEICYPVQVDNVEVIAEQTTEVVLVANCTWVQTYGGLDVTVVLNHPPYIEGVSFDSNDNSKYLETCETATVEMAVREPDGDPLVYEWSVEPDREGAIYDWTADENALTFYSVTPGDYVLTMQVCDQMPDPLCATHSVEIHVSMSIDEDGNGMGDECDDVTVVWTKEEDFEKGQASENVLYADEFMYLEAQMCSTPYMWAPSTADNRMVLFDLETYEPALLGPKDSAGNPTYAYYPVNVSSDNRLNCSEPSRLGQDEHGNVFVTCRSSGNVIKMAPNGDILWSIMLPNACNSARGAAYIPKIPSTDSLLYVGCSDQPYTFVLKANDQGQVLRTISTITSYGLASDSERVYISGRNDSRVQAINIATNTVAWTSASSYPVYGIAASDGYVWISTYGSTTPGSACKLDASSGRDLGCISFQNGSRGRGVAISPANGTVWVAINSADGAAKIDPDAMVLLGQYTTGASEPTGISFDADNNVYISHRSGSTMVKMNQSGKILPTYNGALSFGSQWLNQPYTYSSDMTGSLLCNVMTIGTWVSNEIDTDFVTSTFVDVSWDATTPDQTEVQVEYSIDGGGWVSSGNPSGVLVQKGEKIRFRVTMTSLDGIISPEFDELRLTYRPFDFQ